LVIYLRVQFSWIDDISILGIESLPPVLENSSFILWSQLQLKLIHKVTQFKNLILYVLDKIANYFLSGLNNSIGDGGNCVFEFLDLGFRIIDHLLLDGDQILNEPFWLALDFIGLVFLVF
jgi:hypothetical protein